MRKTYPYLQASYTSHLKDNPYLENPYVYDLNQEQEKRHFLALLDNFVNQRQYINMTLLDWQERPLKEIDGIIESGSITKDGSSSVRRSASLSCSVDGGSYDVDSLEMDFSLNKKVFIEIGVKNETDKYPEWPILWFPQGVFYINSFSMNSATSSAVNLSLQLKDKMCLLNGDVGGTLPATVQFDTMTTQLADGTITEQKVLYYNIITELVNHWGEEDLNNIIIQDVPLRVRRVMQWNGANPIYLYEEKNSGPETSGDLAYQIFLEKPSDKAVTAYSQGDDIGYVYTDFIPTSEITGAAGDTVCTILDTIKNQLGNYEYFYDVFGIFHFREIKNYLNITQSNIVLQEMGNPGRHIDLQEGQFQLDTGSELQYLVETTSEKVMYSFTDANNITSITSTPSYENIKNDFIICGLRQSTTSDTQYAIRYRCVIDEKPEIVEYVNANDTYYEKYSQVLNATQRQTQAAVGSYGTFNDIMYYTHPETSNGQTVLETNRLGKWTNGSEIVEKVQTDEGEQDKIVGYSLPTVGNMDQIYRTLEDGVEEFWIWTGSTFDPVYLKDKPNDKESEKKKPIIYSDHSPSPRDGTTLGPYHPIDWRTFLYLYGLEANALGLDPGPYYQDIYSFWPNEYDLRRDKQCFFGEEEDGSIHYKSLAQGNFYFDIIDASSSELGQYSVQNIGRRADVYDEDDINCLFRPEIPNVVFLNMDHPEQNWSDNTTVTEVRDINTAMDMLIAQRDECNANGQPWVQVSNDVFSNLTTGGYLNSAYEALRYEIFAHTKYQKAVSITALPAFYLEPNSRVEVSEQTTNTYGDFMVQNISLTLGPGANMAVTLNEVSERL